MVLDNEEESNIPLHRIKKVMKKMNESKLEKLLPALCGWGEGKDLIRKMFMESDVNKKVILNLVGSVYINPFSLKQKFNGIVYLGYLINGGLDMKLSMSLHSSVANEEQALKLLEEVAIESEIEYGVSYTPPIYLNRKLYKNGD